jgi:hypothetical protein
MHYSRVEEFLRGENVELKAWQLYVYHISSPQQTLDFGDGFQMMVAIDYE